MTHAFRACIAALAVALPAAGFAAGPVQEPAAVPAAAMPAPGEPAKPGPAAPAPAPPAMVETAKPGPQLNETQRYCQNIAAAAADARFAWQRKQLTELEGQLNKRIADLEERETAFKTFLAHRDAVMKAATDTVVGIYAHMKPETAAKQIAGLDDELAVAVLTRLTQKQASTILNEVEPDRAVKLITTMTAAMPAEKKS